METEDIQARTELKQAFIKAQRMKKDKFHQAAVWRLQKFPELLL
jgi:hypothetical protein